MHEHRGQRTDYESESVAALFPCRKHRKRRAKWMQELSGNNGGLTLIQDPKRLFETIYVFEYGVYLADMTGH